MSLCYWLEMTSTRPWEEWEADFLARMAELSLLPPNSSITHIPSMRPGVDLTDDISLGVMTIHRDPRPLLMFDVNPNLVFSFYTYGYEVGLDYTMRVVDLILSLDDGDAFLTFQYDSFWLLRKDHKLTLSTGKTWTPERLASMTPPYDRLDLDALSETY